MSSNRVLFVTVPFGALLFAALAGCAARPWVNQHIDAVNAEYRELEVYSYELEAENRRLCDEVESLKDENTRLKGGSVPARRRGPFSAPATEMNSTPRSGAGVRPRLDPEPTPSADIPEITIPDTPAAPTLPPVPRVNPNPSPAAPRPFPGGAATSRPSTNVSSQKPAESSLPLLPSAPKPPRPISDDPPPDPAAVPTLNPPAGELPPPNGPEGLVPEPIDKKVTHLFLNPLLTRGANFDARPGDDGLAVVLEPRNQAGQFVPQAAPVSIVVLDPAKQGDAARVARWTLDESLLKNRINRSRDQRGIHLQLPWSGGIPETSQLKLFVRYEAADGRKIEAQHDLILNPAAQASQRWTPRNANSPRSPVVASTPSSSPTSPTPSSTTAANPLVDVKQANPPLPTPGVKSDLTQVIQEPVTPPTVASNDGASKSASAGGVPSGPPTPALLAPPPGRSVTPKAEPSRPEWKPFR